MSIRMLLVMLAVAWLAQARAADPTDERTQLSRELVPTHQGAAFFRVENLDAPRCRAWRAEGGLAAGPGLDDGLTSEYALLSRVIVRAADAGPLLDVTGRRPGARHMPFDPVPGYWIVTTPTVRDAIAVARELGADARVTEAYLDMELPMVLRAPTDPMYPEQWHLNNTDDPLFDINAEPAWDDAGYTGLGVTIGIVEGGWQYDHPDLADNFHPEATQSGGSSTSHATSCAGVAAAVAFNDEGGCGVAYNAQVSGQITGSTSQTASAFAFRNDLNDIKSNSWGPPDNGTVWPMPSLVRDAIIDAVYAGRGGLGTVITWAAGNGGTADRVDYDGYASSRLTLAIGSIGDQDVRASYNELGSSMFAVTQSSGNSRYIYTTRSSSGYTQYFGGTSAASPAGAGVIALLLEANPTLTWRDVMHVLVNSVRICHPDEFTWEVNDAGHLINYNYGFGALDAHAAVLLAEAWEHVGPEREVDSGVIDVGQFIPDGDPDGLTEVVNIGADIRVETVELILNINTQYVGDLVITLTSPGGTASLLAAKRSDSTNNYEDFVFTTFRAWDEFSAGEWVVHISDRKVGDSAIWDDFQLRIYGSSRTGDMNCDGYIDAHDINPFVLAMWGPERYDEAVPGCDFRLADANGDGVVNLRDINSFAELLGG